MENKPIVAICYDFDKTLAEADMQSFSFIPNLKMTPGEFWSKANKFSTRENVDGVLSYLKLMIDECKAKNIKLTKEYLMSTGKNIKLYNGVSSWFKRLNSYASERGIKLEHYIISSGNKEILEGCPIYKELTDVFGCEFVYDKNGEACWPKNVVNYTLKTQYIFRIVKGLTKEIGDKNINMHTEKKRVEYRNMIYIGDGLTDIPSMTLIKEKGGIAISVYQPDSKDVSISLLKDSRVNYACKSDYSHGSELDKIVKLLLDSISIREQLNKKESNQMKKIKKV